MKLKALVALGLSVALFTGCSSSEEANKTEETDAVTSATETIAENIEDLATGMSANGSWIIIMQQDLEASNDLVVEGEFTHRDNIARKLAFYTQDSDRNITGRFTLTAPSLTIKSENTKLHGGTFVGDVIVEAAGLELVGDFTIDGNLTFANEEVKASANLENGTVTGTISVAGAEEADADAVTGATQIMATNVDTLLHGISEDGAWIILFQEDMTVDTDLVVAGEHIHREAPARKLALYTQDADRNVTAQFTLTAPSVTIQSENARVQGGTIAGDVIVEAAGFHLTENATIEGNLTFANADVEASANVEGTVTGDITVK